MSADIGQKYVDANNSFSIEIISQSVVKYSEQGNIYKITYQCEFPIDYSGNLMNVVLYSTEIYKFSSDDRPGYVGESVKIGTEKLGKIISNVAVGMEQIGFVVREFPKHD